MVSQDPSVSTSPSQTESRATSGKAGLFRWQGLLAFVAIVAVFAVLWFLVLDSLIERLIERTGTSIVGAKVELDEADLSLAPLGLTLTHLQVTDPDAPMRNAVEVARIALTMDGLNLLRRKAIIEEMTLDSVRFGTPRKRSGAISRRPSESQPIKRTEQVLLPTLTVPDVKDVLEKENLQSVALAETMRADVQKDKERWQKRLAELPDKKKLEQYKAEVESLKKGGQGSKDVLGSVLSGAQKAEQVIALQRKVTQDLEAIQAVKGEVEQGIGTWRGRIEEATRAPLEDAARLKAKYGVSAQGASNITRLLFGPRLADLVETGTRWEVRLRPILQRIRQQQAGRPEVVKPIRGKGMNVRFKEHAPLPDVLIRTAHASVELKAGALTGTIRNITPDQHVLGAPLTFTFTGEKLKGVGGLALVGTINRVKPDMPLDTVSLTADDYRLTDLELARTGENADAWVVHLTQGRVDGGANFKRKGDALQGTVVAAFKDVKLNAAAPAASGRLGETVADILDDVRIFRLDASVTGTTADYDLQLTSNLDQVIGQAVIQQIGGQLAKFEGDLQAAIAEKVSGPLQELKKSVGGLDALTTELTGRLNVGNDLLKGLKPAAPGGLKLPF
jgi:uncharacterized protein (TIGR03545 family)